MAFKIKVIVEAETVQKNLKQFGLSESMMQCWIRNQVTVLSGKLKMSAKRAMVGYFTLKYPKLDKQVMGWFPQQRDQGKYFISNMK